MDEPALGIAGRMLGDAAMRIGDAERWLVIGGDPMLPLGLADRHAGGVVRWGPLDVRDLDRAREGFAGAPETGPDIRDDPARLVDEGDVFDAIVFETSLHRPLVRRWLALAHRVLVDGGTVVLAGANDTGVRSAIGDATRLFGDPVREDYRRRHRVATFRRGGDPAEWPYWFDHPGIAPGSWLSFEVEARGHTLELETLPGVFPGDRLDAGTSLLLEHLSVEAGARVLDAGCGAGVIGLLAERLGAGRVDLVDANLLAVAAARANVARLGISGARVLASDVYSAVPDERYDLIVSNPPFHQGKAIDTSMPDRLIAEAPDHLRPGGCLLVVANSFLRYERHMDQVFRRVETVAATRQYHVISARDPR